MGAVYSVYMKLLFEDEKALEEAMRRHFKECLAKHYGFRKYGAGTADTMSVRDFAEAFAPDVIFEEHGEHMLEMESGFDATYSWESVLYDMFNAIAPTLKDGSELRVFPDDGGWTMVIRGGKTLVEDAEEEG